MLTTEVTIDPYYLSLLVAVVLPALVALVTKRFASGAVKSLVLLFLTIVLGFVTELQNNGGGPFDLEIAIRNTVVAFVIAVAVHYGLLQPLQITGKDGAIQKATGNVGVGSNGDAPSNA